MADPPLPYDQLTLSFRVLELGGWDKVMFKFPAGSNIANTTIFGSESQPRSYWLCTEHVTVRVEGSNYKRGQDAVLAICAQRFAHGVIGQIIDVREKPKDTRSGVACRRCVRNKTAGFSDPIAWGE